MEWFNIINKRLYGQGIKILLVNPPLDIDCGISENPIVLSPPLGLGYLATIAQQLGLNAAILDGEGMQLTLADTVQAINAIRPDVLGFGILTPAISVVQKIVKSLQPPYPLLIAGGIHPSVMPRHTIDTIPELDYVIRGEAEEIWQTICQYEFDVPSALEVSKRKGLVETQHYKNTLIIKAIRPPDLRTIPRLDHSNFPKVVFLRDNPLFEYTILGSRGCPFHCKFCAASAFRGHHVNFREIDDLIGEIEASALEGPPRFHLVDDNTLTSKRRILKFTEALRKRGLFIEWRTFARADQIDREIATALRDSGCYRVAFGVESGSQASLRRMNKQLRIENVLSTAELCREFGIQSKAFFILGYPGDTVEDFQATIDLAAAARFDEVQFNLARAFPGTQLYEELCEAGYSDEELLRYDNIRAIGPNGTPSLLQHTQYCVVNHRSICSPFSNQELAIWIGRAYEAVSHVNNQLSGS